MTDMFDSLILGKSEQAIQIDTHEALEQALISLTRQCRRHLNIFTHTLDRRIYNGEALYQAMLALATRSRHSNIRIIIKDSSSVVKYGSRLVNLGHRLSSRIQFRNPPVEYHDYVEEFMVADDIGYVHRPLANRYDAHVCFKESSKARQLNKFFDDCWLKSAVDPNLRRLDI